MLPTDPSLCSTSEIWALVMWWSSEQYQWSLCLLTYSMIAILCNGSYSMQLQLFYVADWPLAVQHVGDMSLGDVVVLAAVPVVLVLADETRVVPGVGRAAVVDYWVQWVSATDTQTRYLGAVQPFCLLGMSRLPHTSHIAAFSHISAKRVYRIFFRINWHFQRQFQYLLCFCYLFLLHFITLTRLLPIERHHPCVRTPVERDWVVGFEQFCTTCPPHI